jgi:hypothetical protein
MPMASADKKPVGFATHVIAGGLAGMSEAVGRFRYIEFYVFISYYASVCQ